MKVVLFVLVQLLFVVAFGLQPVDEATPHYIIHSGAHAHPAAHQDTSNLEARAGSLRALTPNTLRTAYGVPLDNTLGAGKTVAIIDAYGASTAENDLSTYSTQYGLPAATTANGMFRKVDQSGGTNYPADDAGWGMETALDVQSVHAMAPGCKILLVVCNSASSTDLFTGVTTAKRLGADYISMSFSLVQSSSSSNYDKYFNTGPQAYFASTGDSGSAGGIGYPAASPYVIAVGGTSLLTNADGSYAGEQGWSGSGGGCSKYTTAIAAQSNLAQYPALQCNGKKSLPDLSLVGDPNSGLRIYYSAPSTSGPCTPPNCWYQVGGTSLSSPLAAARAAIRGVAMSPSYVYTGGIVYRDITVGNNGGYQCTAGIDKVTGLGSWVGAS